jgi:hypothetical protein
MMYTNKGVLLNGFNWWVYTTSYSVPWFGEFTPKVFFLCCFSAVYGLSISVILKRFGSLTRTFISTVAVVLNAILDTMFFDETLSVSLIIYTGYTKFKKKIHILKMMRNKHPHSRIRLIVLITLFIFTFFFFSARVHFVIAI